MTDSDGKTAAPAARPDPYAIDSLRAQFARPEHEDAFRAAQFATDVKGLRSAALIGGGVYLAFVLGDIQLVAVQSGEFLIILLLRLLLLVLALWIAFRLGPRAKSWKSLDLAGAAFTTYAYVATAMISSLLQDPVERAAGGVILVIAANYLFLPTRFPLTLLAGLLGSGIWLAINLPTLPGGEGGRQWAALILLAANMVAALPANRMQRLRRNLYLDTLRLQSILDAAPNPIAIFARDGSGRSLFHNSHALALHGLTGAALDRLDPLMLLGEADRARFLAALQQDDVRDLEVHLRAADGRSVWGLLTALRMEVTGQPALYVSFNDITARKAMEERLREFATTDGLTGVFNRRHFMELAEEEFQRSRRYGHPLSLAMIDADHFKKVNDRHGHDAGDQVLRSLCAECRRGLRDSDRLGRLGGEEFAVLLAETAGPAALDVAERLRSAIAALDIPGGAKGNLKITVSLGVAEALPGDSDIEAVISRADAALYKAKRGGRNKVVVAAGPGAEPPDS